MTGDFDSEHPALFDLSGRAKFRITGGDRLRYLNGQISNDLRKASETTAIHGCVLSAKGKINAEVFIVEAGESFLIDTDEEMREQLPARLERYIIADDVQIDDVSDDFGLFHLTREVAPTVPVATKTAHAARFGCAGTDVWIPAAEAVLAIAELSQRFPVCDDACAEIFRMERGVPRWGRELTDEIIPIEAGLEANVIDYNKGCYIGQEVISRMKMSGQTNKRLCGFVATTNEPLRPGMRLWTIAPDAKDVGWVTSAVMSRRVGKQIALGYLKRGFQEIGSVLEVRDEGGSTPEAAQVQIVRLPFV